ncbi:alpha/beta hydrolase [Salinivibrio sp. ML198]|uniref:alpha/beta family hydrolase n=1 Tax=unclassified Salinivibrio TaxID=2636825 RepID=UPI000985FA0F|nr:MULTISPECIES: alpha/beta family hydrolase [unclassified Salinivibrio]OOE66214.1 alpha/beta hydrolase [Salinivibrio sp. IB868]OOE76143.1 alpha/beta hydrolase [Salinivibrio sp. IB870]OOE79053.1 alpha/beta hydrolase [Salinivibrio sp. ML198]
MTGLEVDGPETATDWVIFAHGAGAGKDHEFMADMAARIGKHCKVVRFNFPYMEKRDQEGKKRPPDRAPKLLAHFESVIEHVDGLRPAGSRLWLAGKSMGGRMASHLTDHASVSGGICLGFPFHPPGKPEKYKGAHLATVERPLLIIQGARDTFGREDEVMHYPLSPSVQVIVVPDGDHSFKPRKASGYTESGNRQWAVDSLHRFIEQQGQQG